MAEYISIHSGAEIDAGIISANINTGSISALQEETSVKWTLLSSVDTRSRDNAIDIIVIDGKLVVMNDKISEVESIAKGASRAIVFTTLVELEEWLIASENTAQLSIGDNLLIVELGVPDFWWDGEEKQKLETQKVDLSNIYTMAQVDALLTNKETAGAAAAVQVNVTALASNVLQKDNTTSFTPTGDYHPATKNYVDESVSNLGGGDMLTTVYDQRGIGKDIFDFAEQLSEVNAKDIHALKDTIGALNNMLQDRLDGAN